MGWLKAAVNWKFGQRLFYGHYLDAKYGNYGIGKILLRNREKQKNNFFARF